MSKPRSLTEILAAKGGRSSHSHDQTESSTLAANTNGFASKSGREIEETEDEMQELEIPSSSTVLHDDSDLLQLLSGATINQNFEKDLSKVRIDVPDGSTQYDIIELYSTIAFLKKENQELRKEIEFSKKSKEAILKETNARYESQLEKMRTENQKYCEDFPLLENELNELRQINEALLQEKDELMEALNKLREKSSQSQEAISVRSELQAVKMENNRLKMEIARLKSDSDSFLQNDLPSFQRQLLAKDQEINDIQQQFSMEIDQLRAESSKEQDQIRQLRNEISDKTQQIAKVTTDFMKLDRQFISMQNENNMLKERLQSSHSSDRELQEAKFRINSLEAEVYELRKLNHQLQMRATDYGTTLPPHEFRQFPSSTAVHSHPIAYETPPPPPNRSSINTAYSDSSYTPYNQPTLYQNSGNSLSRNQNAPKSLSAMGITANRMAVETSAAPSSSSSLLSVLQSKKDSPGSHDFNYPPAGTNRRNVSSTGGTPFATDLTSVSLMQGFDQLERDLTNLMTEKATLQEESERLHQRGLKTLKDRTRLQQVEHRLNELSKDISHLRMRLSSKPA